MGKKRWFAPAIAAAAVLAAAVAGAAAFHMAHPDYAPPVIQGVQARIELYEDEDVQKAITAGVTAVGGVDRPEPVSFPVAVQVLSGGGEAAEPYAPGEYTLHYTAVDECQKEAAPVEAVLVVLRADRQPPVISGVRDQTVEVGGTPSYRAGVTAVDDLDGPVRLKIDSSQVDLTQPGDYPVTYSAADSHGNASTAAAVVHVIAPAAEETSAPAAPALKPKPVEVTQELVDSLCDKVLARIVNDEMSQLEKARAIFDYIHGHVRFIYHSDKSSWLRGAYEGLALRRGDCFVFCAASKALLSRVGIPYVDVSRTGGRTNHYWLAVNVGDGYYHFDPLPTNPTYPIRTFLLTDAEVKAYSELRGDNYYTYDHAACPVNIVDGDLPEEERDPPREPEGEVPPETPPEGEQLPETEIPGETPPEGEQPSEAEMPEEAMAPEEIPSQDIPQDVPAE